jgi:hypothetical protein
LIVEGIGIFFFPDARRSLNRNEVIKLSFASEVEKKEKQRNGVVHTLAIPQNMFDFLESIFYFGYKNKFINLLLPASKGQTSLRK